MLDSLFAGGSAQKPVNSCYSITAAGDITNQMRTAGETIDNGASAMNTDRFVSSFTVRIRVIGCFSAQLLPPNSIKTIENVNVTRPIPTRSVTNTDPTQPTIAT